MAEDLTSHLSRIVAGENAAIWGYGLLLAYLDETQYPEGLRLFNTHRDGRDWARLQMRELGATPPRPKPSYELPFAVNSSLSASNFAGFLEDRLAGLYARLTSAATASGQSYAFDKALELAGNYYFWTKKIKTFPGAVE